MSDVIGRSGPAYYRNDSKNQQPVSVCVDITNKSKKQITSRHILYLKLKHI